MQIMSKIVSVTVLPNNTVYAGLFATVIDGLSRTGGIFSVTFWL